MAVVYVARTEACTLMLDERGVCQWAAPTGTGHVPARIVGAQFVASLDVEVDGGLVSRPREGVPMLFARTDREARISLIRTTNLVGFDECTPDRGTSNRRAVRPVPCPAWTVPPPASRVGRVPRPTLEDLAPRCRTSSAPPPPVARGSSNDNSSRPVWRLRKIVSCARS